MSAKLYFIYDQENNDAVPFLWDEARSGTPDDAHCVKSLEDYQLIVRDVMGGSNRSRSLLLVDNRAAADVLARQLMAEENAKCVITDLGEDRFCVGATLFSGAFDDGIPLITILTAENIGFEVDFDLDPSVTEITSVFDSSNDEHKTLLEITARAPDMEPI